MQHRFEQVNGTRLHFVEEGAGPLVLLLHGFPDFWYSWRHQIPALVAAGYRVVAPDLRGYNLSEKPGGVHPYRIDELANDISALLQRLDGETPTLIGHDWGGVIAWHLAMHRSNPLQGMIVLNAPHPATFRRELLRPSTQILRSSYAAFFQLPVVPEALLSARNYALLRRALRRGPASDDNEVEQYVAALSPPGALSAALNYYRAALRYPGAGPVPIRLPTLLLWGDRDPFLLPELTRGLDAWVENLRVTRLPDAGHWLHISHADQVNREILAFLQRTLA